MLRILAVDVGDKRIGLAVSDGLGITAQGLETYQRTGDELKDAEYIVNAAKRYAPDTVKIVFGLPRNMDGSYGFACDKVRQLASVVASVYSGEIDFYDERLTTMAAERVLFDAGMDWKKRRKVVDKMAATIILQDYLDFSKNKSEGGF